MTLARLLVILALTLAAPALSSCQRPAREPRLVLLYATCTLNKSFLSPYASGVAYTPQLENFARRGVVFRRHQTEAALSGVAFASLLSGTQATHHGVFSHPSVLHDGALLITEAFAQAGWDVYVWADHEMASPGLNYAQGVPEAHRFGPSRRRGGPDPSRAAPEREAFLRGEDPRFLGILERLRADPAARALLVTQFTVTHAPYSGAHLGELCERHPAECIDLDPVDLERDARLLWRHYVDLSWDFQETVKELGLSPTEVARLSRVAERLYAANVHRLDGLFGAVLEAIEARGLEEESLVAFTADHGEVLHRENAIFPWNHGFSLAPEELGVPWILAGTGVRPGSYEGVTRSIDVFPTLAALSGVPVPQAEVTGQDLSPALAGREPPPRLLAFSHSALVPAVLLEESRRRGGTRLDALHPRRDPELIWVSVRDGDRVYKLTRPDGVAFVPALHDLARDPMEAVNLHDPADPQQRIRFEELAEYRADLVRAFGAATHAVPSRAREREMLRSLGYVE